MTIYQGRGAWTKTNRTGATDRQVGRRLGVAVHWPGFKFLMGDHDDCLALVYRLEHDAVAGPYGAIPYNEIACAHGYRIEGRGVGRRSGANGSLDANRKYGSVCALLPIGAKPNGAMLEAIRSALHSQVPEGGGLLRTHRSVRPEPTQCPGPALTAWIAKGAPAPAPARKAQWLIREGDSLWGIAERVYGDGAKWEKIAKANGLTSASILKPGKHLVIP